MMTHPTVTFTSICRVNVIMVSRLVLNLQEPSRRDSVEHTEDNHLMMTTVIPLDDAHLSLHVDDPGRGQRSTGVR